MSRLLCTFTLLLWGCVASAMAQTSAPPQTARQALLEMFLAKAPTEFFKHFPIDAQKLMRSAPGKLPLDHLADLSSELQRPGMTLEAFDTGANLLVATDPVLKRKIEVAVEGDEDEIQLGIHVTRDGQPETLPVVPTITCTMKSEAGIWRLNDIGVTMHMPLGDPEFLKGLAAGSTNSQDFPLESSAVASLRTLNTAEITYASIFPNIGYTCALSDLGGTGDTPQSRGALLVDGVLASGTIGGYVFAATGCTGSPVDRYQIVAVPSEPDNGQRAFCTDETAVIRVAEDEQGTACLTSGQLLK